MVAGPMNVNQVTLPHGALEGSIVVGVHRWWCTAREALPLVEQLAETSDPAEVESMVREILDHASAVAAASIHVTGFILEEANGAG